MPLEDQVVPKAYGISSEVMDTYQRIDGSNRKLSYFLATMPIVDYLVGYSEGIEFNFQEPMQLIAAVIGAVIVIASYFCLRPMHSKGTEKKSID
jgi:hypothetical protein